MCIYSLVIYLVSKPEAKLLSVWQTAYLYFLYNGTSRNLALAVLEYVDRVVGIFPLLVPQRDR